MANDFRGIFGYEGEGYLRRRGRDDGPIRKEQEEEGMAGSWSQYSRSDFSGDYARDTHYEGLGDDYARERPPDDRIADEVNRRLTDDPQVNVTDFELRVENGEVTLNGIVQSRAEKRRAEDIVDRCVGVRDVHNRLRIEPTIGKASE